MGVPMSVYGALIREWRRVGAELEFGPLRAYTHGRSPDAILNFWRFIKTYWWYFEVNAYGTLNLKVNTAQDEDGSRWDQLTQRLAASGIDSLRSAISERPARPQAKTVCSWKIGLWCLQSHKRCRCSYGRVRTMSS